jgi:organic radical activating enzyme
VEEEARAAKKILDSVSPSFCLAKWKKATVYLQNGTNHSCFLPPVHSIPIDSLTKPTALHNTAFKKLVRRQMLAGERPAECAPCWQLEDLGQISERMIFAQRKWAKDYLAEVKALPPDGDILPSFLEVSFSSVCNFKCSYCSPSLSSKWEEEILKFGPYPLAEPYQDLAALAMPISAEKVYVKAFWEWWPELSKGLRIFRITGGEPLLSPDTFKVLDWLSLNPQPQLELQVNSNFGVRPEIVLQFSNKVGELLREGKIKKIVAHASIDAVGKKAEYIRHGLSFSLFENNLAAYLDSHPKAQLSFMSTFNALSVVGFRELLEWVFRLRAQYSSPARPILFDLPFLVGPTHQNVKILPPRYQTLVEENVGFLSRHVEPSILYLELDKLKRIVEWMKEPLDPEIEKRARADFFRFFFEHDRRRGTSFLSVFPEMQDFWDLCKAQSVY